MLIEDELVLFPLCARCWESIDVRFDGLIGVGKCACSKERILYVREWEVLERFSAEVQTLVMNSLYPWSRLSQISHGDVEREVEAMVGRGTKGQLKAAIEKDRVIEGL